MSKSNVKNLLRPQQVESQEWMQKKCFAEKQAAIVGSGYPPLKKPAESTPAPSPLPSYNYAQLEARIYAMIKRDRGDAGSMPLMMTTHDYVTAKLGTDIHDRLEQMVNDTPLEDVWKRLTEAVAPEGSTAIKSSPAVVSPTGRLDCAWKFAPNESTVKINEKPGRQWSRSFESYPTVYNMKYPVQRLDAKLGLGNVETNDAPSASSEIPLSTIRPVGKPLTESTPAETGKVLTSDGPGHMPKYMPVKTYKLTLEEARAWHHKWGVHHPSAFKYWKAYHDAMGKHADATKDTPHDLAFVASGGLHIEKSWKHGIDTGEYDDSETLGELIARIPGDEVGKTPQPLSEIPGDATPREVTKELAAVGAVKSTPYPSGSLDEAVYQMNYDVIDRAIETMREETLLGSPEDKDGVHTPPDLKLRPERFLVTQAEMDDIKTSMEPEPEPPRSERMSEWNRKWNAEIDEMIAEKKTDEVAKTPLPAGAIYSVDGVAVYPKPQSEGDDMADFFNNKGRWDR